MKSFKDFLIEANIMTGYKVMRWNNGKAISGADSRQGFTLKKGKVVTMSGDGIYMSLNKDYVIDYYAIHDQNVLITFEFDIKNVVIGNLTDKDTEFGVSKAKIIKFEVLDEDI